MKQYLKNNPLTEKEATMIKSIVAMLVLNMYV